MTALDYWEGQFTDNWQGHAEQNWHFAKDICGLTDGSTTGVGYMRIREALQSKRIIEIGAGTGELTGRVEWMFRPEWMICTDLSPAAVNAGMRRYPFLRWRVFDVLNDEMDQHFDLAIACNMLEHFTDPHAVISRIFGFADMLLAVVPYRQPVTDRFEGEGGPGHVFSFSKRSFDRYTLVESALFESDGWTYSSRGEKPRQLAALIKP